MNNRFDRFVGIDWSGAKGTYHKGIQVAVLDADTTQAELIAPPDRRGWSRQMVMDWLMLQRQSGLRVLAGFDFAFAHPFMDENHYFPDYTNDPRTPPDLWALVDAASRHWPDHYGGGLWQDRDLRRYYNAPRGKDGSGGRGDRFMSRRRLTELNTKTRHHRAPSPTFNCVGPAGVGTGSLAGMRILHAYQNDMHIWPISGASPMASPLVVVEIFPALYFTMAGITDRMKAADPLDALNRGLAYFGADSMAAVSKGLPDWDDLDALISAAALKSCHDPVAVFPISAEYKKPAACEGWIFGSSCDNNSL
jgi:hypothetical protein